MKAMWIKLLYAFASASLLVALVGIQPAHAAGILVDTNADTFDVGGGKDCTSVVIGDLPGGGDGLISLREAICAANNTAGADSITFAGDYTIALSSQLPAINDTLTIDGTGHKVTINGKLKVRVLYVNNGKTLILERLTITNGYPALGNGGGIYTDTGTLNVTNSTFSSNLAFSGGGIYINAGTLTVTNSTFSGNGAQDGGGAIFNGGTLTVTDSTFSGNREQDGGGAGIANWGVSTVTNSTFSGNNSDADGGAIRNSGTLTVTNSTFYSNRASYGGGGINNLSGTLNVTNSTFSGNSASVLQGGGIYNNHTTTLRNTIVANSTSGGNCYGPITNGGNNLDDGTTCGWGSNNNSMSSTAPLLGSLADNGGPTQTMALLPGSPAIDGVIYNAPNSAPSTDQRGVSRPQGTRYDIGAYEYGPVIPVVTSTKPSANATLSSLTSISVTFNQDMLHDGSAKAANNTANYLLVERGANGSFDTQSCKDGLQSDDTLVPISGASYNSGSFSATLTLASSLTNGHYRLFICGTTSNWSVAGLELNNGADDTTVDFTISPTASALPATGFPQGQVSLLPPQPANQAYAATDLTLEIPALGVKTSIVGVPRSGDSWDVSWLGSEAGWLDGSAFPTWAGNTVLTGHVWNADNTPGIFVNLKTLKYGDQVKIKAYGKTYTYEVRESRLVWPSQTNVVLQHETYDWLTLVTCEDYNLLFANYPLRRMVRAVLISVK